MITTYDIKITDIVQAASAVIMVFVTIRYAGLTKKILEVPNQCLLKPIDVNPPSGLVKIKNVGPGMAINVVVETVVSNSGVPFGLTREHFFRTLRFVPANGEQELESSTDKTYEFNHHEFSCIFNSPLVIRWQTITGKKRKSVWCLYTGGQGADQFLPATFITRLKFAFKVFQIRLNGIIVSHRKKPGS